MNGGDGRDTGLAFRVAPLPHTRLAPENAGFTVSKAGPPAWAC